MALLALLLSSAPALAADGVTAKKITLPPKKNTLRHFRHWGNKVGEFKGTLERLSTNRAFIRDADGTLLKIPLFYFSAPDLAYFLNRIAQFPKDVTDYTFDPKKPAQRKLIDLRADDLPLGPLKDWKNLGLLGGKFLNMNKPPVVETILGRKGVTFRYQQGNYMDPN